MSPSKKVPLIVSIVNADYDANVRPRSTYPINDPRNEARYMAMYMIRYNTSYTLSWIDKYFSFTNAHNVIARFETRMQQERTLWMRYERLQQILINSVKDSKHVPDTDFTRIIR